MGTASRVRILGETIPPTIDAPMPLDDSLEWISPHERLVDGRVRIFFMQSAHVKCVVHAASDMANEVGGILVGQVRVDPMHTRPYIVIEDILPALHAESGQTYVTFTKETLVELNSEMENGFPDKRIVGWYHTHPQLGVFLSNYDTWLHANFFNDPFQVALVIDPFQKHGGFFCWQTDRPLDPQHYVGFYELDDTNDESVVDWNNLKPVIDPATGEEKGEQP